MGINPVTLQVAFFLEQDMLKAGQYIKKAEQKSENIASAWSLPIP